MKQARLRHGHYVQTLYDQGVLTPKPRPALPDGHTDIPAYFDMLFALIPCEEHLDRDTDVRQVIYEAPGRIDYGATYYREYSDLIGYRPLDLEIGTWMRANLLPETERYVRAMECNNPVWRWADFSMETIGMGEEKYTSPHLAFSIFQTKAYVLNQDYNTLLPQLPWTVGESGFRDRYRLMNLVALLRAPGAPSPLPPLPPRAYLPYVSGQ
jgi:hypothetical protein